MITSCYSELSLMKAHCSKMSNFLAYRPLFYRPLYYFIGPWTIISAFGINGFFFLTLLILLPYSLPYCWASSYYWASLPKWASTIYIYIYIYFFFFKYQKYKREEVLLKSQEGPWSFSSLAFTHE